VDHPITVDVHYGRDIESTKTISHTYSSGKIGKSSAVVPVGSGYDEIIRRYEGVSLLHKAGKANKRENTRIKIRGDCFISSCYIARWGKYDVVEFTASGNPEVYYKSGGSIPLLFGDGSTKSVWTSREYSLMHELGHSNAFIHENFVNFHDVIGNLNPSNPYSLGAGVHAENLRIREDSNYPGVIGRAEY
jgi:hypothetical protein